MCVCVYVPKACLRIETSLADVGASDARAEAVEGAEEVLVRVARGVALATHSHGLDHATTPQLHENTCTVRTQMQYEDT
jgi:hypothetical protein